MNKIPSFTIDHLRLLRGIYVSRKDEVNGEIITTFDIRMKEPNREPALGQGAPMIAAIWGVFIWREFKGASKSVNQLLALMFLLFIGGLALIVAAGN